MALPTWVAPSRMLTVAPASATSTVPEMVWLAWLTGPPALLIAMVGAVVSSVKINEAWPALLKLSALLATTVLAAPARPIGVNAQLPCPLAVTVVAIGLPLL